MIGTLRASTLADEVENSLLNHIRESGLRPGDQLPREEELAELMQVSRHIVREGVRSLKAMGMVESRKRRGTVLTHPDVFAGLARLASARLFSPEECAEFMELRVFIELGIAEVAFERKTPEKLRELRRLAVTPGDAKERHAQEVKFHSALAALAGNSAAGQLRELLSIVFRPEHHRSINAPLIDREVTHAELCDELESGTAEGFHRLMRRHLAQYLRSPKTERKNAK